MRIITRVSYKTSRPQKIDDFEAHLECRQAGTSSADGGLLKRAGEEALDKCASKGRFYGGGQFCNWLVLFFLCLFASIAADPKIEGLKQRVCNILPSLEGWCNTERAVNFIDLVLEVQPDVCVDIGVFGGKSLFPVASALKYIGKGIVIGIDPWDKVECIKYFDPVEEQADLQWWGRVNLNYIYSSYLAMIKKYELEKCTRTIRATSENAADEIDSIDILYIDGNHSEEASLLDVELYLPKVRQGGYIWMNDALWPSRQAAVDLLVEHCDAVKLIDNGNCILFKKR